MPSGYINLTTRCPHSCINCPIHSSTLNCSELPLDEICSTIDSGLANGMTSIVLSGGEPTFHSRFFDVIRYLEKTPLKVSLLTTAVSFSQESFVEKLIRIIEPSRLRLACALHSFNPAVNDAMTQNDKTFPHILRGMHNAVKAGISTTLKYLITKPTYRELPEFARRYCEEFPAQVPLLICNIDYCGRAYEYREELLVPFSESRPYLEKALDYLMSREEKRAIHVLDTPLCVVSRPYWHLLNSQAGQVIPVYHAPANRAKKPVVNIRNESGPYFESCDACCVRHVCPGAWKSAVSLFPQDIKAFTKLS